MSAKGTLRLLSLPLSNAVQEPEDIGKGDTSGERGEQGGWLMGVRNSN